MQPPARPPDVLYTFLEPDPDLAGPPGRMRPTASLTYGQLLGDAGRAAAGLTRRHPPGSRVVLALPTGPEFAVALFGCFLARMIAVPVKPARPGRGDPAGIRQAGVLADAGPAQFLTADPDRDAGWGAVGRCPVSTVAGLAACGHRGPDPDGLDLAFLQYTSGTTSRPRGVAVPHGALAANHTAVAAVGRYTPTDRMGCWLPLSHDFGLVGGLLQPAWTGFPAVLFPPESFLADPRHWPRVLSEHRITCSGAPNFAFDLYVRRTTPADRTRLDLSVLRVLKNGAEAVRTGTMAQFTAAFAPHGFRESAWLPCYGLAKATLFVAGRTGPRPAVLSVAVDPLAAGEAVPGAGLEVVSCGPPGLGFELAIVALGRPARLPAGKVGEVWIRGPSVAAGYCRPPAPTRPSAGGWTAGQTTDSAPATWGSSTPVSFT